LTPQRRLLIDGRRAHGVRTGIGHYTLSLLQHWPAGYESEILTSAPSLELDSHGTRLTQWPSGVRWHLRAAYRAIQTRALYFSPESLIVPFIVGSRATLTLHDLTPLRMPKVHTARNVLIHRLLLRMTLLRVGRIIVPSVAVQKDLEAYMPSLSAKVRVIHEGPREIVADGAHMNSARPLPAQYALYVGTIEPRKNVTALIDAFTNAASPEWSLVIVGRIGWLSSAEKDEFLVRCNEARILYLGYLTDAELTDIYSRASLFCYPSDAEGFGLPVLEAMAHGLPVVVSDDPALLEVAGGAGWRVRRSQLREDLSEALQRLTRDGAERERLKIAGEQRVSYFSWDRAALATAETVNQID
jgi:glycosyltransferase involved in cell wall biosynthesis